MRSSRCVLVLLMLTACARESESARSALSESIKVDQVGYLPSRAKLAIVTPNQGDRGTHMNISGGGMLKNAPHPAAATRFLEYLASDEAQAYFADGNNEWPTVASVKIKNPDLAALGAFKQDSLAVTALGKNQAAAQRLADRAGYR